MDTRDLNLKQIKKYNGYYATNTGDIYSNKRGEFYKIRTSLRNGYKSFTVSENGIHTTVNVHRLVAEAFIPNINNKPCINHLDGNKQNNNIKNLEWCTYSENEIHSRLILGKRTVHSKETREKFRLAGLKRNLTKFQKAGVEAIRGKPSPRRISVILNDEKIYDSIYLAAKDNNILSTSICNNLYGLSKRTKVGIWKIYRY